MVENRQIRIKKSDLANGNSLADVLEQRMGTRALRWYVGQTTGDELLVEATVFASEIRQHPNDVEGRYYPGKSVVLNIIPTGVGCSIGGYAGDAAPVTNLLASTSDYLLTNPNSVNASDFIGFDNPSIVYTDGHSIDLFSKGLVDLRLPYSNRVGLIIEKCEDRNMDVIFNILNTVRAVHGIDVKDYVITEGPIGGRCVENDSGAIAGTVDNLKILNEACEKLLDRGVNAIAVTSDIQDLPMDGYARHFDGEYPNPVGGVEAIISYSITNRFKIPSAHAPLINVKQLDLRHNVVDARGAGEISSVSGLACVLIGLRRAPQIDDKGPGRVRDIINVNNLMAVVAPASALGGIPMLYAEKRGIPVIAVEGNRTVLNVRRSDLNMNNVIEVTNYAEAAGVLMAIKSGINLESLVRPLKTLRY